MKTRAQRRQWINNILRLITITLLVLVGIVLLYSFFNYKAKDYGYNEIVPNVGIRSDISLEDMDIIAVGKLEDSINRPLLMSTRRPYVAPKIEETVSEAPLPPAKPIGEQLVSIIITEDVKVAFLNGKEGAVRLEEGMTYNGWVLDRINADSLELSNGKNKEILELRNFATSDPTETLTLGKSDKKGKK